MSQNKLLLLLLLLISVVIYSCKTEEPNVSKLQIISPNGITEHVLNPETNYNFSIKTDYKYDSILSNACLIRNDNKLFYITTSKANFIIISYKSDTIPDEKWARGGTDSIYIKGRLSCYGIINNNVKDTAEYEFLIPHKPNKPQITLLENTITTTMSANIGFKSTGATRYCINYIAYGEAAETTIAINDKISRSYNLTNLNPAKKYSVYVQAINNSGTSASDTLTIGSSYTTASCVFTKTGTDAKYQIKVGETIMDNMVINSAAIYNSSGVLKMTVPTVPNQYFSIASLPTGGYVLKVIVKDYGLCSKTFLK